MIGQQRLSRRLVRRFERTKVGVERHLRVDDDRLAAWELDDDVGANAPVVAVERLLLDEVAVLDHAGQFDDPLQLKFAPSAPDAGPLQRIHQPPRFGLKLAAVGVERRDALQQRGAFLVPAPFRALTSVSTRSRVFAMGASRSSMAFLRASMSALASVRACRRRVSASCRNVSLFCAQRLRTERLNASRNDCSARC